MRRYLFPLFLGLVGCAVLVALGLWQMGRLEWKQALIIDMTSRLAGAPSALPERADPEADRFLPVALEGTIAGPPLTVLVSAPNFGPAFRLVVPVRTAGERRILVDLGLVPADDQLPALPEGPLQITGNLHWPQESDLFTPEPEGDLWFVRDVEAMAATLGTERLMVVARQVAPEIPVTPLPLDTAAIRNNHLEYAMTWFMLAVAWAAMSVLLIVRRRREL